MTTLTPPTNDTASNFEIPMVDFSSFLVDDGAIVGDAPTPSQLATAQAIHNAGKAHGFVCLRHCGVNKDTLSAAFNASENLFLSLSNEEKKQLKRLDPKTNTGYAPFQGEALNTRRRADLKEAFNIRNTDNDYSGTPEGFDSAASGLWDDMKSVCKRYAICCALALDLPPDYFAKAFDKMDLCTLRMLHYPPLANEDGDEKKLVDGQDDEFNAIRVGEHTDFGLFTFLFVRDHDKASSHGLQVKAVEGGDLSLGRSSAVKETDNEGWHDVVLDEPTMAAAKDDTTVIAIVNTGALLARWTNDVWRATAHRVIVNPAAANSHRFSIACFFDPDRDTVCAVQEQFVPPGESPKYPPVSSQEYLEMKLREVQGID